MYKTFSLQQKPHLRTEIDRLSEACWPKFLLHGNVQKWDRLFDAFAPFQILFCDQEDRLIAVGHTVPLAWSGASDHLPATIDDIIQRAGDSWIADGKANTLSALAAMIWPSHRNKGLSTVVLEAMKTVARRHALTSFIAPVRPAGKAQYPLTPFDRYANWTRPDGLPFDPWIRTHWRMGARPMKTMPGALTVTGAVADWESWTGLTFPESGDYVVEGAFEPVRIDTARNEGRYQDTNLWMKHLL